MHRVCAGLSSLLSATGMVVLGTEAVFTAGCTVTLDPAVNVEDEAPEVDHVPTSGTQPSEVPPPLVDASTDDNETDSGLAPTLPGIGSDLALWLDATVASSFETTADGISVWSDLSGNNANVRQATPTAQPALISGAIRSNAAVRFDGSSDVLEGPVLDLENYDLFIVWQSPIAPPTDAQTHLLRSGPGFEINHGHNQASFRYAGALQATGIWVSAQFEAPTANTAYAWNFSFDATLGTLTAFTNGVASATSDLEAPLTSSEPLTLGSRWNLARHFTGDIGEVILYRRVLTMSERLAVQGYLDDKWGL